MKVLAAAVVAILALQPLAQAFACSPVRRPALLPLDDAWRETFGEWFVKADGVHLVMVSDAGPLEGAAWPMPCDRNIHPPPPAELVRGKAQKAEFAELWRSYEADLGACIPGRTRVHVVETLKGPSREDWVEQASAIQVVDGPPPEPVLQTKEAAAYGAWVADLTLLSCGAEPFARRMSRQAAYVVLTAGSDGRQGRITHAFLADDPAPFLAEARRLARPAP